MDTSKYSAGSKSLFFVLKRGEVLIVKLDNVKARNEESHSVTRIYFVIIYYSPQKLTTVQYFLPCEIGFKSIE